jgi:hypothetical protein
VAGDAGFSLPGVPAGSSGLVASASTYATGLWPFTVTDAGNTEWSSFLRPSAVIAKFAHDLGTTDSATAGAIHALFYDGSGNFLAGASITTSAGGTVGYTNAGSTGAAASPAVTTATGEAWVFGLTPGTIDVTMTAPGLACSYTFGWPALDAGDTASEPIQAGGVTNVSARCK